MKFTMCQIDNVLINPPQDTTVERFYDTFWQQKKSDGYFRPSFAWELPLWIAEISYTLPRDVISQLHIVSAKRYGGHIHLPESDYYLFSVLDVNRDIIEEIIFNNPRAKFVCGGYTKLSREYPNVIWCDTIQQFCNHFGLEYRYGTDYFLFAGIECIPRLTLSTGCKHHCKFCIVPNQLEIKTPEDVRQQCDSFKPLKFKLVYLNDKTFGQADNCHWLDGMYRWIKSYNPEFEGFIVQTTASMVCKRPIDFWEKLHIKVVEIGVETFNDNLLKRYRKPASEHTIDQAIQKLAQAGVTCIANIILGLPGETEDTYYHTADFLKWCGYLDYLYSLNIYTLAAYADSDLGISADENDVNELHDDRSFWTPEERDAYRIWSERFYTVGIAIVGE